MHECTLPAPTLTHSLIPSLIPSLTPSPYSQSNPDLHTFSLKMSEHGYYPQYCRTSNTCIDVQGNLYNTLPRILTTSIVDVDVDRSAQQQRRRRRRRRPLRCDGNNETRCIVAAGGDRGINFENAIFFVACLHVAFGGLDGATAGERGERAGQLDGWIRPSAAAVSGAGGVRSGKQRHC